MKNKKSDNGFSLLVMSVAISALVSAAVFAAIYTFYRGVMRDLESGIADAAMAKLQNVTYAVAAGIFVLLLVFVFMLVSNYKALMKKPRSATGTDPGRQAQARKDVIERINELMGGLKESGEVARRLPELFKEYSKAADTAKTSDKTVDIDVGDAVGNTIGDAVKKLNFCESVLKQTISQTSGLSLNAALEASNAGDAGRGLVYVAEDVRVLAEDLHGALLSLHEASVLLNGFAAAQAATLREQTKPDANFAQLGEKHNEIISSVNLLTSLLDKSIERLNAIINGKYPSVAA